MKYAPIALFVYNRPWHTQQTVESLKKNRLSEQSDLFIFSDSGKNQAAEENVFQVRKYIQTVTGFKKVTVIRRESNFGLAKSIVSGVSDLIHQSGTVIVVEDDLYLAPDFLMYMNRALTYYQNDEQVMQISGHMFPVQLKASSDAVFLPFTTSWGWATWERAWKYFDPSMSGYPKLKEDKNLRFQFDIDGSYPYFKMLENQINGKIDSWAIRWQLSVFMRGGLTLYPTATLVQNIGCDGSGTHFKKRSVREGFQKFSTHSIDIFPKVKIAEECLKRVKRYLKFQQSFMNRLIKEAGQFMRRIRSFIDRSHG